MKKVIILLSVIVGGVVLQNTAFGLESDKLNYGFMPGISFPVGNMSDDVKSSLSLGAAAEYSIKDDLRLSLEAAYNFKYKSKTYNDFYIKVISITPVIKKLWTKDKILYSLSAGAGIYYWKTPSITISSQKAKADSGTALGINFGAGTSYEIKKGLLIGGELKFHHTSESDGDIYKLGEMNTLFAGVRLDYKFK